MALLIDADIIAYKACSAAEQEVEFEPDEWHISTDLREAVANFNRWVARLHESAKCDHSYLCFSDQSGANFRKQLNPTYKANRSGRKPVGYKPLVAKLFTIYKNRAVSIPNVEADDVIGLLATRDVGQHIIWSEDKDLDQIPGSHLGSDGELYSVTPDQGALFFYRQVLTGDLVDNYKGVPGVGPVTANKILAKSDEPWSAILGAYERAGLTATDALLNARMAHILQHGEYDHIQKKANLWTPTS